MLYSLQDANISFTIVMQILDFFGTMAFAVSGAFKAIEYKFDIVGIIILSTTTGLAGGVSRDLLFGDIPLQRLVTHCMLALQYVLRSLFFFYIR